MSREDASPTDDARESGAIARVEEFRSELAENLRRGQSEEAMGRPDQAAQFYQRILRSDPGHRIAHQRLAKIAALAGDDRRAERHRQAAAQNRQGRRVDRESSEPSLVAGGSGPMVGASEAPLLPHLPQRLVGRYRAAPAETKELRLAALDRLVEDDAARRTEPAGAEAGDADGNLPLWSP